MIESAGIAVEILDFVSRAALGRELSQWLSNREQRTAFRKAVQAALKELPNAGHDAVGFVALDRSFTSTESVKNELWRKLLDPGVDEEIDYSCLGKALEDVYDGLKVGPSEREVIEFFVDTLIDKMWSHSSLHGLLTTKITRQHDERLTLLKKRRLVHDYLARESARVSRMLQRDLGEGKSYVEPLIEKKAAEESRGPFVQPEDRLFEPIHINTYFESGPDLRVAIVADSGFGKTTLLRELFMRISNSFDRHSLIPVYFTPSEASDCSEATIFQILRGRFMSSGYRSAPVEQFVSSQFHEGNFVFCIDALDQVSNRGPLIGSLGSTFFRRNRVIVTSRPNVWDYEKGHLAEYALLRIREFDCSRWTQYLSQERVNSLRQVVDEEFFSVPILVKLISEHCLETAETSRRITSRAELYRKMFNAMLTRQEDIDAVRAAKGRANDIWYTIKDLRKLAHDTLAANYLGQFPRSKGAEILGESKMADLEARSGILTILECGQDVAFRHRSFQEYLAAESLLTSFTKSEYNYRRLDPYLLHPNWEEPIRFLVGLLSGEKAEKLVNVILDAPPDLPLVLYRDNLRLGSVCLREMRLHGQIQRARIVRECTADLRDPALMDTAISVLETLKNDSSISVLCGLLKHGKPHVRVRAAEALGEAKSRRAVKPLVKALGDKNEIVSFTAQDSLAKIRSSKMIKLLIGKLGDADSNVRWGAAEVLGEMRSLKAIRPLIETLKDEDTQVRASAARALGAIKSSRAVRPLFEALKDVNSEVRADAVRALAVIKPSEVRGRLIEVLSDEHSDVRKAVVTAVRVMKSSEMIEPLISALEDESYEVRWEAAGALGEIPAAVERVIEMLKHGNPIVREGAARALEVMRSRQGTGPLIDTLKDENAEVRKCAVRALKVMKSREAFGELTKMLRDGNEDVRSWAAGALTHIAPSEAAQVLVEALSEKDSFVREVAAAHLREVWSGKVIEALVRALRDEDFDVRRTAANTLGEIRASEAVGPLIDMLRDQDPNNRWMAARALGALKALEAIRPLVKAVRDHSASVRWEASTALGKIKAHQSVAALILALQDQHGIVRTGAAWALNEIKPPEAVEPLIKALVDEKTAVSYWAASALGRIRSTHAVKPLAEALEDRRSDVQWAAEAALGEVQTPQAITALTEELRDCTRDHIRVRLLKAIRSCDREVRRQYRLDSINH